MQILFTLLYVPDQKLPRGDAPHEAGVRVKVERDAEIFKGLKKGQICLKRPPDTAPQCHKMDPTRHAVTLLFYAIFR